MTYIPIWFNKIREVRRPFNHERQLTLVFYAHLINRERLKTGSIQLYDLYPYMVQLLQADLRLMWP